VTAIQQGFLSQDLAWIYQAEDVFPPVSFGRSLASLRLDGMGKHKPGDFQAGIF